MKKLVLLLFVLSVFNGLSQSADEFVQQSDEIAAAYPKDARIKGLLVKALRQDPNHEAALYKLAQYHIAGNTDIEALPLLNTAIAINPTNANYYWLRAKVNIRENALKEDLLQAKEDLNQAIVNGFEDTARIAKAENYVNLFISKY